MAKKKIILSFIFSFLIALAFADALSVNEVLMNPSSTLQGSSVSFCADVTSTGLPNAYLNIQYPVSKKVISFPLPLSSTCFSSPAGNYQFFYLFQNTQEIGEYKGNLTFKKGGEESVYPIRFNVTSLSVIVDFVKKVGEVDKCKQVDIVDSVSKIDEGKLSVHGTEYSIGQFGKVWVQLLNSTNEPVDSATCFVNIFKPLSGYLYQDTIMLERARGVYEYNFIVPSITGVYPTIANCYYSTGEAITLASAGTLKTGTTITGDYTSTWVSDNSRWRIDEALLGGNYHLDMNFTFTGATVGAYTTDLVITWEGKWDGTIEDLTISIYNFTSQSWVALPNKITNTFGSEVFISNTIHITFGDTLVSLGYKDGAGRTYIRISDTALADTNKNRIETDYLDIKLISLISPDWEEVRGSSEIHVSSSEGYTFGAVTLCGESDPYSGDCAKMLYDESILNVTYGIVVGNVSFTNNYPTEDLSSLFLYETALGLDCTAIVDVIRHDSSGSVSIYDDVIFGFGTKENCLLKIPVDFDGVITQFKVEIQMENYLRWEVEYYYDLLKKFNETIYSHCLELADNYDYEYELPISGGYNPPTNAIRQCHRALDDLWWVSYYYQNSLDVEEVGLYESYLFEMRFYYPLIFNHFLSIISPDEALFNSETLCGTPLDIGYRNCALFYEDPLIWDSFEGLIVENITITNKFGSPFYDFFEYETTLDVDCSAFDQINVYHENGSKFDIYDDVAFTIGTKNNCHLDIPIIFENGEQVLKYELIAENYMKWNFDKINEEMQFYNKTISDYCNKYADEHSLVYGDLPISVLPESGDRILDFCYNSFDDIYWFNFFYDESKYIDRAGEYESYLYEGQFFQPLVKFEYTTIKLLQLGINQTYMIGLLEGVPMDVWSYNNRTLSSGFVINANINNTKVAEAVWNYEGSIVDNILTQFGNAIWQAMGAVAEIIS